MNNRIQIHKISRIFVLAVLVVALVFSLGGNRAAAAEISGTSGDLSWKISNGVLTISGSGAMRDYQEHAPAPWMDYADQIQSVIVNQGVTSVGEYAFFELSGLKTAELADSVERVGSWAFFHCAGMESVKLSSGLKEIGDGAFEQCGALKSLILPKGLEIIRSRAFYRCDSILTVTIPASVIKMENAVFAYCHSLQTAVVLADIEQLPIWTFYGCDALTEVTLGSSITSVGQGAVSECENLEKVDCTGSEEQAQKIEDEIRQETPAVPEVVPNQTPDEVTTIENSTTVVDEQDHVVTTDEEITQSDSSTIRTEVTTTISDGDVLVEVDVQAEVRDPAGWEELEQKVDTALGTTIETAEVEIHLKGSNILSGSDLARFAGKRVRLTIINREGVKWHVDGRKLGSYELAESYDLGIHVDKAEALNELHQEALGPCEGFFLKFAGRIDFPFEVEIPLGGNYIREDASFFTMFEGTYFLSQTVLVNDSGAAHFFLGLVDPGDTYLIGIDIPVRDESGRLVNSAYIPEEMTQQYPSLQAYEHVEYVVTGVNSSLGINISQLTWILFGGMGALVVVVGVVVNILFKRKLKAGYVPDMSYADEVPQPKPIEKKKLRKK